MNSTAQKTPGAGFKALAAAAVSHIFWGFSFMASRTALDRTSMFTLLSHRFLIALAVMSAALLFRGVKLEIKRGRLLPLLLLGIAQPVVYFFGEQFGMLHSSTIFSGVMIAIIPIVSTLAAVPLLGERVSFLQLLFSLISVGGVIGIGLLTKSSGVLDIFGVIGLSVAIIGASAYNLLGRSISSEFSPFTRTYVMLAVGAAAFTITALINVRFDLSAYLAPLADGAYLLSVGFLGVCCSVISFFLMAYAITSLSIASSTVFANLTTAVSVFAGAVLLKEPFSWLSLVFSLLILAGICGVQLFSKRKKEK